MQLKCLDRGASAPLKMIAAKLIIVGMPTCARTAATERVRRTRSRTEPAGLQAQGTARCKQRRGALMSTC